MSDAVAVFDVGKSSAKLALVDGATGAVTAIRTTPNLTVGSGTYPHFDTETLWRWLIVASSASRSSPISLPRSPSVRRRASSVRASSTSRRNP